MKVDKGLIEQVASVARLKLTEKEVKKLAGDFKEILEAFSAISKCDTKGIKPSFQPVELKDITREDLVEDSLEQKDALSNAEHKKDGYFKGPKAV